MSDMTLTVGTIAVPFAGRDSLFFHFVHSYWRIFLQMGEDGYHEVLTATMSFKLMPKWFYFQGTHILL